MKAQRTMFSHKKLMNLYFKSLDSLGISYEFITVETSFGETNLIATGNKQKPPLVLVHSLGLCAPFALERIQGLMASNQIYVIDLLGQSTLSEKSIKTLSKLEYSQWFYELSSRLQWNNLCLCGLTSGCSVVLKSVLMNPHRVAKVILLDPRGIFKQSPFRKFIYLSAPLTYFRMMDKTDKIATLFFGNNWSTTALKRNFIKHVFRNPDIVLYPKQPLSDQELKQISLPIYWLHQNGDPLIEKGKHLRRAQRLFSGLKEIRIIDKNIGFEQTNKEITKFIKISSDESSQC